jgi:TolB-like protein
VRPQDNENLQTLLRLAILPFSTEFGVPDYLGPAISEETGAHLKQARFVVVSVLAHDSVTTLARRGLSPQEMGNLLNADLLFLGTVSALPTHYRVKAMMIRSKDGSQLWIEDLLVERDHLSSIVRELTNRITSRLQEDGLSISSEISDETDGDPLRREAWETFHQAHQEWQTFQRHDMQDALRHLSQAVELDPLLAPARVDLANLCVTQSLYGFMSPTTAAGVVKHAAAPGPRFPLPPEAILPALGWINFHVDRDLPAALRAFSLSAHLPHDVCITRFRTMFALSRHRVDEAIGMLRAAIRLDPWSPSLHARLGWALHLSGQSLESVRQVDDAISKFPDHFATDIYGAVIMAYNGESARAVELAHRVAQRFSYSDLATAVHAYALACDGQRAEARMELERLEWLSQERFVLQSFTAAAYVALGENGAALEQLRASDTARCPWFFQILADPRLKPLHGHPEFNALQQTLSVMEAVADRDPEQE